MSFLKFILVVILLLMLAGVVRIGLWYRAIRRTWNEAQQAARRMYGNGPYMQNGTRRSDNTPQGKYADYEEISGDNIVSDAAPTDDNTTTPTTQVIDAKYEELP